MDASLRQVGTAGRARRRGSPLLGAGRGGDRAEAGRIGSRGETGIGVPCPGPAAPRGRGTLRSPRAAPRPRCPLTETVPVALSLERWDAEGFVPERSSVRRGIAQPVRGVEGVAGAGARPMCGVGNANRGLLAGGDGLSHDSHGCPEPAP